MSICFKLLFWLGIMFDGISSLMLEFRLIRLYIGLIEGTIIQIITYEKECYFISCYIFEYYNSVLFKRVLDMRWETISDLSWTLLVPVRCDDRQDFG